MSADQDHKWVNIKIDFPAIVNINTNISLIMIGYLLDWLKVSIQDADPKVQKLESLTIIVDLIART
jgi:hypothetical protein